MTNGFDKLTTDGIIDKLTPMPRPVSLCKHCPHSKPFSLSLNPIALSFNLIALSLNPIALSLSKGFMWFDRLTTNGMAKLTTNGGQGSPRTGSRSS